VKIKLEERLYGKRRAMRFVAKIIKSPKHGIPKTVQKTWRVFCADPMYERSTIKEMCLKQARRWQHSMMLKWFGSPEKFPTQMDIEDDCNEAGKGN